MCVTKGTRNRRHRLGFADLWAWFLTLVCLACSGFFPFYHCESQCFLAAILQFSSTVTSTDLGEEQPVPHSFSYGSSVDVNNLSVSYSCIIALQPSSKTKILKRAELWVQTEPFKSTSGSFLCHYWSFETPNQGHQKPLVTLKVSTVFVPMRRSCQNRSQRCL